MENADRNQRLFFEKYGFSKTKCVDGNSCLWFWCVVYHKLLFWLILCDPVSFSIYMNILKKIRWANVRNIEKVGKKCIYIYIYMYIYNVIYI